MRIVAILLSMYLSLHSERKVKTSKLPHHSSKKKVIGYEDVCLKAKINQGNPEHLY